jgi:ABC-type proline/glycine betaine transport system substrate-binding protein
MKEHPMQKHHLALGLLAMLTLGADAADAPPQSCEEIRAEIMEIKGLEVTPNTELLKKISLRSECQFTSAEVYRAAYGDKPLPPPEQRRHDYNEQRGNDD